MGWVEFIVCCHGQSSVMSITEPSLPLSLFPALFVLESDLLFLSLLFFLPQTFLWRCTFYLCKYLPKKYSFRFSLSLSPLFSFVCWFDVLLCLFDCSLFF